MGLQALAAVIFFRVAQDRKLASSHVPVIGTKAAAAMYKARK